jgi:hypothetical protein
MFDVPLTYNYNEFSKELVVLGQLGSSDLILQTWQRCKIQDLYKDYYFFRYCVCLGMRAMGQIMGMFEFKLPGGVTINSQMLADRASEEMNEIFEWLQRNHAADYFFNTNTI